MTVPRALIGAVVAFTLLGSSLAQAQTAHAPSRGVTAAPPAMQTKPILDAVIAQVAGNPFLGLTPQGIEAIESSIDGDALQRQAEAAAARTYTPAERAAITKFYASPAGQAILRKAPEFIAQVTPAVQAAAMQAVAAYMAQRQMADAPLQAAPMQAAPSRAAPIQRGATQSFGR